MRKAPAYGAKNDTWALGRAGKPGSSRPVVACSNAGGTGPLGRAAPSGITSTEWGRLGSWFLKWSTPCQPCGTVTSSAPRLKPLKFMPPFSSVRPPTNLNSAVLLAASARSHAGSIFAPDADCASAVAAPRSSAPVRKSPRTPRTTTLIGNRILHLHGLPPCSRLVEQPRHDVEGVVVRRLASEAIVVARTAIELVVPHVLELEPQVLPRHEVHFGNQSVIVRTAGATAEYGAGGVQQGVTRAGRHEGRQRERVALADVVHRGRPEGAQRVRRVGRGPADAPRLLPMTP